jgi:hypothetical protein
MSCVQGSRSGDGGTDHAARFGVASFARLALAAVVALAAAHNSMAIASSDAPLQTVAPAPLAASSEIRHYEYVCDDGTIYVYDMDRSHQLVRTISLPQTESGIRGVTVDPASHRLFISYGGDGLGFYGSVLAYDLVSEQVVWTVHLNAGIDSGQVSPDGSRLYMPTGENTPSGVWNVLDTSNGAVVGTIQGGSGAHNTIASNDGRYVYLGGREYDYLDVYDTATGAVRGVGPLKSGVRPFTVNAANTLAFTTATGFDGFQISSIATGKVLFTVSFGPVPQGFPITAPSHGASLSPDEKQLYVIDSPNKQIHVYDVSRVAEGVAPSKLGTIAVAGLSGTESPCAYDCGRGGWLQHSLDGRFVYVGDSGEVIDTANRQVLTTLPPLLNTKKMLEIDWAGGVPVATSGRTGVGHVGSVPPPGIVPPGPPPPPTAPPASQPFAGAPAASALAEVVLGGVGSVAGVQQSVPALARVASIRHMSIFPRSFRAVDWNGAATRRRSSKPAATVRFEDTQPSTTTFSIVALKLASGISRHACADGSGTVARRCYRPVTIGRFVLRDRAGWNRLGLSGWLGARKLSAGPYRLQAVPSLDGRVGAGATVAFQIVP